MTTEPNKLFNTTDFKTELKYAGMSKEEIANINKSIAKAKSNESEERDNQIKQILIHKKNGLDQKTIELLGFSRALITKVFNGMLLPSDEMTDELIEKNHQYYKNNMNKYEDMDEEDIEEMKEENRSIGRRQYEFKDYIQIIKLKDSGDTYKQIIEKFDKLGIKNKKGKKLTISVINDTIVGKTRLFEREFENCAEMDYKTYINLTKKFENKGKNVKIVF